MRTITINEIQQNVEILFSNYNQEPVMLKDNHNHSYILMPFSQEEWQEIQMLYPLLNKKTKTITSQQNPQTFEEFDKKWCGFMKNVKLSENWRDEYINDKITKHQ